MHRRPAHAAAALVVATLCAPSGWGAEPALSLGEANIAAPVSWDDAQPLPSIIADAAVQPAQMLMLPSTVEPYGTDASWGGSSYSSPGVAGVDGVPYMIGDSGLGPSAGYSGLFQIEINHPSLSASRLSVADANSPLPVDRLYYSYRHLENASGINFFGLSDSVNLDRHLIGWERTFWNRSSSLELRLPIDHRLNNRVGSRFIPAVGDVDPIASSATREVELGNIAAIFKFLVWENSWAAVSGGLGIELPTAQDFDYAFAINGEIPFPNNPGLTGDTTAGFLTIANNETVFLDPFLAWVVKPADGWFHQGFLQVDVAANSSRVLLQGGGDTLFLQNGVPIGRYIYSATIPSQGQYTQQTLLRLNLGGGRILVDAPQASGLRHLAIVGELHYTTTLNEAHQGDLPLTVDFAAGTVPVPTTEFGGLRDDVHFLNAVIGASLDYAGWTVVNGVVAPLEDSPDRGFDFQYNLQVHRPY
jgi:hypothetical protein